MYALLTSAVALATAVSASGSSPADNVATCCDKISQAYPDQVVYESDDKYELWTERWADSAELPASCIFRPFSAEDVSFAVKTFSKGAGKCSDYCPFSIKGGGHTPWPGANSVDGGVALDMGFMNQTVIADDKSFVELGTGTRWHDAYASADGAGIAFPGGRCPGTGVGGLTLGGGYSWFSGEKGFVADTVINFEVVLASGEIVNANKEERADLFKALKGGSNNFGVVTTIKLAAFEHSQQVYGGLVIVPESKSDDVLAQFQKFTDDSTGYEANAGLTVEYFLPSEGEGQILLWLIDTVSTGDHAPLQPFFEMEPKLVNQVYQTSIADYPTSIPPVNQVLMSDVTFFNDLEVIKGVHKITKDVQASLSHVPGLTWDFQLEPLPRHLIDASIAHGGNVLGLEDAKDDLLILFLMPLWEDAAYNDDVRNASEKWLNDVQEYTNSLGKGHPFEFANYAASYQDPMSSYGAKNLAFLKETSEKYDPTQLFQRAVGGYKLH